jgi:hypothetical protein
MFFGCWVTLSLYDREGSPSVNGYEKFVGLQALHWVSTLATYPAFFQNYREATVIY